MAWTGDFFGRKRAEQEAMQRRMARFDALRDEGAPEKSNRRLPSETTALWWARFKKD